MECAAIQDVLVVGKGLEEDVSRDHKVELDRMAAMLSRLGKPSCSVQEEPAGYAVDFDPDETNSQPDVALNADKPRE